MARVDPQLAVLRKSLDLLWIHSPPSVSHTLTPGHFLFVSYTWTPPSQVLHTSPRWLSGPPAVY
jgi:hypothetical protein